jgi:hypothetical protein
MASTLSLRDKPSHTTIVLGESENEITVVWENLELSLNSAIRATDIRRAVNFK